jgi:hypothetical protein
MFIHQDAYGGGWSGLAQRTDCFDSLNIAGFHREDGCSRARQVIGDLRQ